MSYSVLIVDDEKKIREGLIRHIDWSALNYGEPLQAADGMEAWECMRRTPIDLLITDIRMPFMDGLALTEKVTLLSRNTQIVVLSGFGEFEYAKKAMQFGVKHYMTKPTDLNQFSQIIKDISQQLERRDRQQFRMKNIEKKYLEAMNLVVEQFLIELVEGGTHTIESINEFLNEHQLHFPYSHYQLLNLIPISQAPKYTEKKPLFLAIRECVQRYPVAAHPFIYKRNEGIHLLLNYDYPLDIEQLALAVMSRLTEYEGAPLAALLNEPYTELFDTLYGYQQTVQMRSHLSALSPGSVYHYPELCSASVSSASRAYPYELEKQLVHAVTSMNQPAAEAAIRHMFAYLEERHSTMEAYRECFARVYFAVESAMRSFHIDISAMIGEQVFPLQAATETYRPHELRVLLLSCIDRCVASLLHSKIPSSHRFVDQVKAYIDDHYMEDISLISASQAVHLSPAYLSKIFKKVTELSFVEYVTAVRVEKAKEWLSDSSVKIYEIGDRVGYRSTKHFSQVFKSCTGLTPSEFRDNIRVLEDR